MSFKREDLRKVNPTGRVDVALYRLAEQGAKHLESQHGLNGVWEEAEQYVQEIIKGVIGGWKAPKEVGSLMNIIQANPHLIPGQGKKE